MTRYRYSALGRDGKEESGAIDAQSPEDARHMLQSQSLVILTLEEDAPVIAPLPEYAPSAESAPAAEPKNGKMYFPLVATLRLYAGWLLAYYVLVYALGWYTTTRAVPFEIPLVGSLIVSPLVLLFTLAAFLFLLLHSIHRAIGGRMVNAILLTILGIGIFSLYQWNIT